jgi:hypothetical protein
MVMQLMVKHVGEVRLGDFWSLALERLVILFIPSLSVFTHDHSLL